MIRLGCALIFCSAAGLLQAQTSTNDEIESQPLGNVALDSIFAPTDLRPAVVVERWASQDESALLVAQQATPSPPQPGRDLKPDSMTIPSIESPLVHSERRTKISNASLLRPIPNPGLDSEYLIRDQQIGQVLFQEPAEPTAPIELRSQDTKKPPQDDQQNNDPEKPKSQDELALEKLASQIKEQIDLISEEGGDETLKEEKLQQLNKANAWVQKANNSQSIINVQNGLKDSFQEDLDSLQTELETPLPPEKPDPSSSSEKLQMDLQSKRTNLQQLKMQLEENQQKMEDRDKRIDQLPTDRTEAEEKLNTTKQDLSNLSEQPEDPSKLRSTLFFKAREWAARKEIEALDIEASQQEKIGKLLPLQRSLLGQKIERLESEIQAWNEAYNEKRKMEIAEQKAKAESLKQIAIKNDPVLSDWALLNRQLADERSNWTDGIKTAQDNLEAATEKLENIDSSLDRLRQETQNGVTTEVGISLVEQRHSLTMPWESQARVQTIRDQLKNIQLKSLGWRKDRQDIPTVATVVGQLWKQSHAGLLDQNFPEQPDREFGSLARQLVESRIKLLDDLNEDYEVYRAALKDEKTQHIALIKSIGNMRSFVDDKALWIRSANPIWQAPSVNLTRTNARFQNQSNDLVKSFQGMASFCRPDRWKGFVDSATDRITRRPSESALAGLVLLCLLFVSQRLRENS